MSAGGVAAALWRLLGLYLLACGILANLALATLAWMIVDNGPAPRARATSAVELVENRARSIDAAITQRIAARRAAALKVATSPVLATTEVGAAVEIADEPNRGRVLEVGPGRTYATPAVAARAARDGDVVDIIPGEYSGESVRWTADHLLIRGHGGMARIDGRGVRLVQDKAIWLVQGDDVRIEHVAFSGARSSDRNGAGIRAEGQRLLIVGCSFDDNETGLLSNSVHGAEIEVLHSSFSRNGHTDGQAHQIYIGRIARFVLRGSYLSASRVGSAVKSRALESLVIANRIVDGADGRSNYTLDFSEGGRAVVLGNELEQGPYSGNRHVIAFAPEHSRGPRDALLVIHNTLVSDRANGSFVWNRSAEPAVLYNNLFVGGRRVLEGRGRLAGNVLVTNAWFARWGGTSAGSGNRRGEGDAVADRRRLDYALPADSPARDAGAPLDPASLPVLAELREYREPLRAVPRRIVGAPDAGAHEYVAAP